MPAARSPAQIEAARRNGARSRGPTTPEGKARSSRNALRHGLSATTHVVVEGEDRAAFDALLADLLAEHAPATSLEAMLLRRLASALWRQERADRLEAAQFAWVEPRRALRGERFVPVDPEADVCLASLGAIRRHREAAAREVSRILRELRSLKRDPLAAGTDEPEIEVTARNEPEPAAATVKNEPEAPAAANANARNEPGPRHPAPPAARRGPGPSRAASAADRERAQEGAGAADPLKSVPWPADGRHDRRRV